MKQKEIEVSGTFEKMELIRNETGLTMENTSTDETKNTDRNHDLLYGVDESPPWYLCIVLGLQHYLTMIGGTIGVPLLLAPLLCMDGDNAAVGEILSTMLFVSGIVTFIQTIFGIRLPIVQGASFAFVMAAMSILSLEKWQCPSYGSNETLINSTAIQIGSEAHREVWQLRIREIQGGLAVAALVQVLIGVTGIFGILMRFIGPLTIAPAVSLIGLSLFSTANHLCSKHWWISIVTMIAMAIFSQVLSNVHLPTCSYSRSDGFLVKRKGFALFKLFPVILTIGVSWLICFILTVSNALPNSPDEWGYGARTDIKMDAIINAKWFRVPYPFQWGIPTLSIASVFGMMAAILSGMVESVGDYYACARIVGVPAPPTHAVNRGVAVEGLGCLLAAIWGTGSGTTSFSENIGAIGMTRVGSRTIIVVASVLMLLLGSLGKFGALFVMIPDPVVGGLFTLLFGVVTAVGISSLQFVDLSSSRNLFVIGTSLFLGLSVPQWLHANPNAINTGNLIVDQVLQVLLTNSMFVGGFLGCILDNLIPGTDEERGMNVWKPLKKNENIAKEIEIRKCYDFPIGMELIRSQAWTRYIPIFPTFTGFQREDTKSKCKIPYDEGKGEYVELANHGQ